MAAFQIIGLISLLIAFSVIPIIVIQNIRFDREEDERELKRENSVEKSL